MKITFVTGATGSGKTALHNMLADDPALLAASTDPVQITELDDCEGGIPPAADVHWLQWRAAEVLMAAADDANLDGHRIVTGIVWPFSLIQDNAWAAAEEAGVEIRVVLLDRPWADTAAHLEERLADWEDEDDRAEQIDNNRRLARTLRKQVSGLRCGHVVSSGDLHEAVAAVLG